jgi:hypothetical protein
MDVDTSALVLRFIMMADEYGGSCAHDAKRV